jgi:hypothetical protein
MKREERHSTRPIIWKCSGCGLETKYFMTNSEIHAEDTTIHQYCSKCKKFKRFIK